MKLNNKIILFSFVLLQYCINNDSTLVDVNKAELGRKIFFDTSLSNPPGQSCASCHDPDSHFTSPDSLVTAGVPHGADSSKFGFRNTPTVLYSFFAPSLYYGTEDETYIGGQFVDQRAADLTEQAMAPFLGAVEMANTSKEQVVNKIMASAYAEEFQQVFGASAFSDIDNAFVNTAQAIAEFERTSLFRPFSSRYDQFLQGKSSLSEVELKGLTLFNGKANCAACHPGTGAALFTDFTNDNIGVPKNPDNPFYTQSTAINPDGQNFIDKGLGKIYGSSFNGKFKVPTLRNISKTSPYFHNGVFTKLTDVVRFYNTSCKEGNPDGWAAPEVSENKNCSELGDLKLSKEEIAAIVSFLETLTDE